MPSSHLFPLLRQNLFDIPFASQVAEPAQVVGDDVIVSTTFASDQHNSLLVGIPRKLGRALPNQKGLINIKNVSLFNGLKALDYFIIILLVLGSINLIPEDNLISKWNNTCRVEQTLQVKTIAKFGETDPTSF